MDNPCPGWLADSSWDNITELDKLPNFHGIMASFEQYPRDWNLWFTSAEPEVAALPGLLRSDATTRCVREQPNDLPLHSVSVLCLQATGTVTVMSSRRC